MDKILVTRSSLPPLEEYVDEIKPLWESHWLTNMGEKHEALRKRLCQYLNVPQIELFTNGHMALEMTLQALDLPKGGEVITTPFTFASTTHAIIRSGLEPVFCDVKSDTLTIDTSKMEELINKKTCAILPVHVYGNICDVETIDAIAKQHGLKVIYDAAHAFGEIYKGKSIGNFGDASCFSFHATKVFNTIEGGAVTYSNEHLGAILYELKNFGIRGPESVVRVGANAKMNEFCAAMGLCNLRHIDEEIERRRRVADRYRENLKNVRGLYFITSQKDVQYNYAYFPVLFNPKEFGISRDRVYKKLADYNIIARKYFYPLTNTFECFKEKYSDLKTPVAYAAAENVLTLPFYADLAWSEVDRICDILLMKT